MIAAGTFGLIAYLVGNFKFADYLQLHFVPGVGEVGVYLRGAWSAPCLGFLWYNAPPAKIFMGDSGALALGGGARRRRGRHQARDRARHRRRPLRAGDRLGDGAGRLVQAAPAGASSAWRPIHHHFERLGWAEPTIVIRFWIIAVMLALARPRHPEAAVGRAGACHDPGPRLRGQKVAVFGLARTGLAAARALAAGGAEVVVWDENATPPATAAEAEGFALEDLTRRRLVDAGRAGALARRAADPPEAALDGREGATRPACRSWATSSSSPAPSPPRRRTSARRSSPSPAPTASRPPPRSSATSAARPAATCGSAATSASASSASRTCTAARSTCWSCRPTSST